MDSGSGGYRGPLRSRRYLPMRPTASSPPLPLPLVLVSYGSPAAVQEDLTDALSHGSAVMVAKGSSFVYLTAHVLSNMSARCVSQRPSDGLTARVVLSRSTGQVSEIKIKICPSPPSSSASPSSVPPPLVASLSFHPHMYEKDKGGMQIVCTHYLEVFFDKDALAPSPIDLLLSSMNDRSQDVTSGLFSCSNRSVHLQLKKRIVKEVKGDKTALVLAVGVVGVDKCLQALAVACKETRLLGRLVVSVEKITIDVKYEDGSWAGRRNEGRDSRFTGNLEQEAKKTDVLALPTLSRFIASNGSKKIDGIDDPQVDEWLGWGMTELTPLMDEKLFKLNDHLLSRTYLVGNKPSLADVVIFGLVLPAAAKFPAAQTLHFVSLLRWADHIQHTIGVDSVHAVFGYSLNLKRPRFIAPEFVAPPKALAPPPAAAAAAPQKGDGKKAPAAAAAPHETSEVSKQPEKAPEAAVAPTKGKESKKEGKAEKDAPVGSSSEGKASAAAPPPPAALKAEGDKKTEGDKKKGEASKGGPKGEEEEPHIGLLDIRVGTIVKVGRHPNADTLYLEEIDLGEEKPRQVISGLVKFVPEDRMQGRRVVVVCNLKPAKMRDVMSYGMVLCCSNADHTSVDPIDPPMGAANGERVTFEGFPGPPLDEVNPKKKILERLFTDMRTDEQGFPVFKGARFMTTLGPITATISNASVA